MAEIHRRTGIQVETLGDLRKLVNAADADGYTDSDQVNKGTYIYFEKGTQVQEQPSSHTGKCSHCMRSSVPANAQGVALNHNTGDTDHSGVCRGSGTRVTGLRVASR